MWNLSPSPKSSFIISNPNRKSQVCQILHQPQFILLFPPLLFT
jgi:hypothetical protein